MMTESGTISVARMSASTAVRPRNWYFDSANAAIELTSSVMSVAITVTKTEFQGGAGSRSELSAARCSSRWRSASSRSGLRSSIGTLTISPGAAGSTICATVPMRRTCASTRSVAVLAR